MKLLMDLFIRTAAIFISAYILKGVVVRDFITAFVVAVVLGLINLVIKPILILLTLPINVLTLGLFTLVINAFLILLVNRIVPGFTVVSFGWALAFGIILALVNWFLSRLIK